MRRLVGSDSVPSGWSLQAVLATLFLLVSGSFSTVYAQVGTPGVTNATGTFRPVSGTGGYEFTANADIRVTALGIFDLGSDGLIDVLVHEVGLWSAGTLVGQVTIPSGTAAVLIDGYRYVNLDTPVDLVTGQRYVIGASYCASFGVNTCGLDAVIGVPSIFATDPAITINNSRSIGSLTNPTFLFPSLILTADFSSFGPNFLFSGSGPPDDNDGIDADIDGTYVTSFNDQSASFSNNFTDQHLGGTTFGTIVDRGGHIVVVSDRPFGVFMGATGGTGTAQIRTCDSPEVTVELDDGELFIELCGSFTGETLMGSTGSVVVTFGINMSVTIPEGAIAFVDELPGSIILISNEGESGDPDITIDDDGDITNLGPEDPPFMTIPDADDDGVADDVDLCLDTTPGANVDVNGCADLQVDADGDGVCDPEAASVGPSGCGSSDVCADTAIPESVPTRSLRRNRYALTGDPDNMTFESTHRKVITTSDTGGCSCEQVIDALGLGQGQTWYGCSRSAMLGWIDQVSP